jgi:hypothetical protein
MVYEKKIEDSLDEVKDQSGILKELSKTLNRSPAMNIIKKILGD